MLCNINILMAQINVTVGDIEGNTQKIIKIIKDNQLSHDLIIFPELCITGYPPEDLLLRHDLFERVKQALNVIKDLVDDCYVLIGYPILTTHKVCYNTVGVLFKRELILEYNKQCLPNYGVFDERRYFTAGAPIPCIFKVKEYRFGICICQDLWENHVVEQLITTGVDAVLCINASPFEIDKQLRREELLVKYAKQGVCMLYVNLVGGQDELVFDGQSCAYDAFGNLFAKSPAFSEHLHSLSLSAQKCVGSIMPPLSCEEYIYQALVLGLRDYIGKNHIPGIVMGLSGGIDSALSLAVAVDAIGADRVHAIMMPSRYTSAMSVEDATLQAQALGVKYTITSIEPMFNTFINSLSSDLEILPHAPCLMEENLQARIRGVLLMAHANKTGYMLLTTSNKSELAVGYATIYGDMAGGFSVLKDVLKTQVYALSNYRNSIEPIIPQRVITRAPSAELAFDQTDQDLLPDYAILDNIIRLYVEENLDGDEIILRGYLPEDVFSTIKRIKYNEYKRRQAAPGVKISTRSFDRDWRYPLVSKY